MSDADQPSPRVLRDEILKRLPQKIILREVAIPAYGKILWILLAVGVAGWVLHLFLQRGASAHMAVALAIIPGLAIFIAGWMFGKLFHTLVWTFDLAPFLLYDPSEHTLEIQDMVGWEALVNPQAKIVVKIASIQEIKTLPEADQWVVTLLIQKGERVVIRSSARGTLAGAQQLEHQIKVILGTDIR